MDDATRPIFILETTDGTFSFKGRYVSSVSTILPVYALPKKKEMSCSKAINQFIVFEEPSFSPRDSSSSSSSCSSYSSSSSSSGNDGISLSQSEYSSVTITNFDKSE